MLCCLAFSSSAAGFPCVMIGTNTSRQCLEKVRKAAGYSGSTAVGNSGLNGTSAKHMVCCQTVYLDGTMFNFQTNTLVPRTLLEPLTLYL